MPTKRSENLVAASRIKEGDEVRWSTRDKPQEVKLVKRQEGRIRIDLASGSWRTYAPDDRLIRLDPKPEPQPRRRYDRYNRPRR